MHVGPNSCLYGPWWNEMFSAPWYLVALGCTWAVPGLYLGCSWVVHGCTWVEPGLYLGSAWAVLWLNLGRSWVAPACMGCTHWAVPGRTTDFICCFWAVIFFNYVSSCLIVYLIDN
jgi:hypothetical protein